MNARSKLDFLYERYFAGPVEAPPEVEPDVEPGIEPGTLPGEPDLDPWRERPMVEPETIPKLRAGPGIAEPEVEPTIKPDVYPEPGPGHPDDEPDFDPWREKPMHEPATIPKLRNRRRWRSEAIEFLKLNHLDEFIP